MSSNFKGVELNYHEVDKQAFVVFKAIKLFRPYLLKYRTKVIVPYPKVRFFQKFRSKQFRIETSTKNVYYGNFEKT